MTSDKPRLLKIKAHLKKRQPAFIRQDAHKRSMKEGWRSPKGLHSKIGDNRKGYRKALRGGYQTPRAVRGMDKRGLYPTRVETLATLATLDPKVHSIIVSGTLGGRKKLQIIEAAHAKGFAFVNATPAAADAIKARFSAKSKAKAERVAKAEQKAKALEAKTKKSDKKDEKKHDAAKADEHAGHAHTHDHQEHAADKKAEKKE